MGDDVIMRINPTDVLCGRGGATNNHPGNVGYRRLVSQHQEQYLQAKKRDKRAIARAIVHLVRQRDGRFLKKIDGDAPGWVDVGDQKAAEKTSQALREGLEVRRQEGTDTAAKRTSDADAETSSGDENARKKKKRRKKANHSDQDSTAKNATSDAETSAVRAPNAQGLALDQWEDQMRNMVSSGLPPFVAANVPVPQQTGESGSAPNANGPPKAPRTLSRTISADVVVPV